MPTKDEVFEKIKTALGDALGVDDDEVISLTPAMVPRWRSNGVATLDAITSGLAPAIEAETKITGISTLGSGATGNCRKATAPARATAAVSRGSAAEATDWSSLSVCVMAGQVQRVARGLPAEIVRGARWRRVQDRCRGRAIEGDEGWAFPRP